LTKLSPYEFGVLLFRTHVHYVSKKMSPTLSIVTSARIARHQCTSIDLSWNKFHSSSHFFCTTCRKWISGKMQ